MSGIHGIFNLDQSPVVGTDLRSMTAMLGSRGPDRVGHWNAGNIGLGHTLLAATPESKYETQPIVHPESACTITADVRLDNRGELYQKLNIGQSLDSLGDATLILHAYLKWQDKCVDHLLGDFAFAIWDPRKQVLFCARDHFGLRPFYYHHSRQKRFVFASSAKAITVLNQVPYQINEGRIANYLVPQLEWVDLTSTFFDGVFRLPPGHIAIVSNSTIEISEYWDQTPESDPGPMSDDDFKDGFLEALTRAVECRLRGPTATVGSMLSGGVDSGSVVAIAKDIFQDAGKDPLPTFSAVSGEQGSPETSNCADSNSIFETIALPGVNPTLLFPRTHALNPDLMLAGYEEPFDTEFMFMRALYQRARDNGIKVVLDGGGADVVLGERSYIIRLIQSWQIATALHEIRAESRPFGLRGLAINLASYFGASTAPAAIKKPLQEFRYKRAQERYLADSIISQEFAARIDIKSHFDRNRETFSRDRPDDYAVESIRAIRPNVTAGKERYARNASLASVDARDPYLDKRLVEFCSFIPGHLRRRDGVAKMILRDTLAQRLPDTVLRAGRKQHVGWHFNRMITRALFDNGQLEVDRLRLDLGNLIDAASLEKAWDSFNRTGYSEQLNKALYLSTWLRENSCRPVVPD